MGKPKIHHSDNADNLNPEAGLDETLAIPTNKDDKADPPKPTLPELPNTFLTKAKANVKNLNQTLATSTEHAKADIEEKLADRSKA